MRSLLVGCVVGLGLATLAGGTMPAEAGGRFPWQVSRNHPWCAFYNAADGITECLFSNIDQCRASVSGVGGFCYANPAWVDQPAPRRARARRAS